MSQIAFVDRDGTLGSTCKLNIYSWTSACSLIGIKFSSKCAQLVSLGVDASKILSALGINESRMASLLLDQRRKVFVQNLDMALLNVALLEHLLTSFSSRYLVTNASRATTEALLAHWGVNDVFSGVICGDEVSVGKPSPEIFISAITRFELTPKSVTVFEDSTAGIVAAQSAGLETIRIQHFCDTCKV